MTHKAHTNSLVFAVTAVTLSTGCSWDSVQHTSYETVESMRRQQCMDRPNADCPFSRTSYDDYQSERERLEEQER